MRVNVAEYPKSLSWDTKTFSMPNTPRGDAGMVENLRIILKLVEQNTSPSQRLDIQGSDSKIDLGTACIRLRPMKLVIKSQNNWRLSDEAKKWLETGDDLYLAAILCSRIKFLAEILYYLDSPKTAAQLQDIALNEYALNWKTKSDINARLVWLRQLGLVDFHEFSLLYSITEAGRAFLQNVFVQPPVKSDISYDETVDEESLEISSWAINCSSQLSPDRKTSIGYILGDVKQFHQTILEYVQLLNGSKKFEEIVQYTSENYGVSASSLKSFISMLTGIGIIERKTDILYDVTDEGKRWAEDSKILDLMCIINRHVSFVFELLSVLKTKSMSNKELAAVAKVSYGFERESTDEIRKRVSMLKAAKLLKNATVDKYEITRRAERLLEIVDVQSANTAAALPDNRTEIFDSESAFFTELRLAAKDSSNFEKLEKLVKTAFEKLGFQSQWLGGSGKTDVLIRAVGTEDSSFAVTVDAKSTATGNVTDGLVDFDTLTEHKRKHHANYSAIVGGSFQNQRLIGRAIDHGVTLLDVDTLERLIRNHKEVPIKVTSYRKLFEKPGIADIQCIEDEREEIRRYGNLLHAVMDCLIDERDDIETRGILSERDIYRSLRSDKSFKSPPSSDEISNMLQFLSSPLIGCVEKTKDGYFAVGTLIDAAQKFEFFTRMCNKE